MEKVAYQQVAYREDQAACRSWRTEQIASLISLVGKVGGRDPRRALSLSQEAYELAKQEDRTQRARESLLSIVINLGRFHYELSQLDQAQARLEEALTLAQEDMGAHHDAAVHQRAVSKIHMGMGLIRWRLGDYGTALERLLTALDLIRKAQDKPGEANLLSNIGMVYGVTGEYEHAMSVYRQALNIYEQHHETSGYGMALNNMAMVCDQAKEYDQALEYACSSLQIARETGHRGMETNALDSAGAAYMGLGRLDEAFAHFHESAMLARELGDRHDELAAWIHIGQLYGRQAKSELSREALQRALALAIDLEDTEQVRHCHQELARLFKEQGDFWQALAHHEQYHEADKAIYSARAAMRFKTLQVVHETETARRDAEITRFRNASLEREIEERRRIEAALRESEARFRLLMEESPIGVHIYAPDGALLHVNRAWRQMWSFGDNKKEPFNILQSDILDKLGLRDLVQRAFSGESVQIPDVELDPEDPGMQGFPRWLRAQAYSLMDEKGQLKNVVLQIEDITEQKRSEDTLRLAQKMESLGALAGGVAHDFNNLLVAMLGQASLALNLLGDSDRARSHVQKVVHAAEQAAELTQQMLAYSGRGHFTVRRVDLNALISEHVNLWQAAISQRVQLQLDLAPAVPTIETDSSQIQQMILSLILNAAEATSQAGRIILRTTVKEVGENERRYWQYTGRPVTAGNYLSLEIIDEASGISPENLSHIFDPFFTTREQGRGLGLAAVLGIVRGHDAGIAVRNNSAAHGLSPAGEDQQRTGGTTFEIIFPISTAASDNSPSTIHQLKSGTVLLIDDEAMVREAVTDILALENIALLEAEDGFQGLDLYREHAADVELVLLDLSMPKMSGAETFRQLRQINPDVRVVLSSGYSAGDAFTQFDGEGPAGFLQKPYSVSALIDEVRRHLRN